MPLKVVFLVLFLLLLSIERERRWRDMPYNNILGIQSSSMGTALRHIIFPQRIVQNVIFLLYRFASKMSSELRKIKKKPSSNCFDIIHQIIW